MYIYLYNFLYIQKYIFLLYIYIIKSVTLLLIYIIYSLYVLVLLYYIYILLYYYILYIYILIDQLYQGFSIGNTFGNIFTFQRLLCYLVLLLLESLKIKLFFSPFQLLFSFKRLSFQLLLMIDLRLFVIVVNNLQ